MILDDADPAQRAWVKRQIVLEEPGAGQGCAAVLPPWTSRQSVGLRSPWPSDLCRRGRGAVREHQVGSARPHHFGSQMGASSGAP